MDPSSCVAEEEHAIQFFQLLLLVVVSFLLAAEVAYYKHGLWTPWQKGLRRRLEEDRKYTDHVVHSLEAQETKVAQPVDLEALERQIEEEESEEDRVRVAKFFRFYELAWLTADDYLIEWMGLLLILICCNSATIITLILFFFATVLYGQAFARGEWGLKELSYIPLLFLLYVQGWADPQYS
jgi:hypothetical protein